MLITTPGAQAVEIPEGKCIQSVGAVLASFLGCRVLDAGCWQEVERWHLGPPESFHYLNQSSCFELEGKESNAEQYHATRRAMDIVGLSPTEQDAIFRIVAAILHLGNIAFAPGLDGDSSRLADDQSKWHLDVTAELLR